MHVALLIDLLTLYFLITGLFQPQPVSRRILCLACLIYLLTVSLRTYLYFAPWFGIFQYHRSFAAIGFTEVLDFFGGFWTFFGTMVLVRGVTYIALAFMLHAVFMRFTGQAFRPAGQANPQAQLPDEARNSPVAIEKHSQ